MQVRFIDERAVEDCDLEDYVEAERAKVSVCVCGGGVCVCVCVCVFVLCVCVHVSYSFLKNVGYMRVCARVCVCARVESVIGTMCVLGGVERHCGFVRMCLTG
jgi:hypothetical protein